MVYIISINKWLLVCLVTRVFRMSESLFMIFKKKKKNDPYKFLETYYQV